MTAKLSAFVAVLLAITGVVYAPDFAKGFVEASALAKGFVEASALARGVGEARSQAAQQPQREPALILGRVVDATTGSPVSSTVIRLTDSDGTSVGSGVLTGSDGRFVFTLESAGSYTLTAQRPGYLDGQFGRKRPTGSGIPLVIRDGDRRGDVTIQLWPWATISGIVVDETGRRVAGVPVEASLRRADGTPGPSDGMTTVTDARGEYQIQRLLPGKYVVAAICRAMRLTLPPNASLPTSVTSPQSGSGDPTIVVDAGLRSVLAVTGPMRQPQTSREEAQPFVYVTTYYGGATDLFQAAPVEVTTGQQLASIGIKLALKPTARVSGAVVGPGGAVADALIRLISTDIDPPEVDVTTTDVVAAVSGQDGSFRLPPVPRGNYLLDVYRPRPAPSLRPLASGIPQLSAATAGSRDSEGYWARMSLTVTDRDMPNFPITMRPGARIAGETVLQRVAAATDAAQSFHLMLEHKDDPPVMSAAIGLDHAGRFDISGVRPGWYVLSAVGLPPGWEISSAVLRGRDITGAPFEIGGNETGPLIVTLGDHAIEVKGDVLDAQGRLVRDVTVVLFSSDISGWKSMSKNARNLQFVRTASGGYSFRGVAAGEYYLAAVDDSLMEGWPAPEVLRKLMPGALRLHIAAGERRVENITMVRSSR